MALGSERLLACNSFRRERFQSCTFSFSNDCCATSMSRWIFGTIFSNLVTNGFKGAVK